MTALALGSAASWLRARGAQGLPLLAACIGPALAIAWVRPYGDAYAYARYVMPCLAPLALLVGSGLATAIGRLQPGRSSERSAVLVGAGLAVSLAFAGGAASAFGAAGQHANSYLGLLSLPAFDARWPDAPAFYPSLGARDADQKEGVRILEVPALTTRTRHLYRQYQLQHGVETWLAPLPGEFPMIPSGPYVPLGRDNGLATIDYVVVHHDVASETARYWRWVYEAAVSDANRPDLSAYMQRHRRYGGLMPAPLGALMENLTAQLGEPIFQDESISVWASSPTREAP